MTKNLEAERLLAKTTRASTRRELTLACRGCSSKMEEESPVCVIEMLFTKAEEKYEKLVLMNIRYQALFTEDSEEFQDCTEYLDKGYVDLETLSVAVELYRDSHQKAQEQAKKKPTQQENDKVKLQPLAIPTFSGIPRDYPQFKAEFNDVVQGRSSGTTALIYLKTVIPENAKRQIGSCALISEAWKVLDEQYGDEQLITADIMNEIRKHRPISNGENVLLISFIEKIQKAQLDLKRINLETELAHSSTVTLIEEKLPPKQNEEWNRLVVKEKVSIQDRFKKLMDYLREELLVLRRLESKNGTRQSEVAQTAAMTETLSQGLGRLPGAEGFQTRQHGAEGFQTRQPGAEGFQTRQPGADQGFQTKLPVKCCPYHDFTNSHSLKTCNAFSELPMERRRDFVVKYRLCGLCLLPGHRKMDCQLQATCSVEGCGGRHVKGAHGINYLSNNPVPLQPSGIRAKAKVEACATLGGHKSIRPIVEVYMKQTTSGMFKPTVTLMDSGSDTSLIVQSLADGLGLQSEQSRTLTVEKVGGAVETFDAHIYTVPLYNRYHRRIATIQAYGVPSIGTQVTTVNLDKAEAELGVTPNSVHRPAGSVQMLVGTDNSRIHPNTRVIKGNLRLDDTPFGPVIWGAHESFVGNVDESAGGVAKAYVVQGRVTLKDFFDTESLGISCQPRCGGCRCGKCAPGSMGLSLKEEAELRLIQEGVTLIPEEQKIVAKYPWIRDPGELPNNYKGAYRRLLSVEKNLSRSQIAAEHYQAQIEDMVTRGVARKLTEGEMEDWKGPVNYLAHFVVENPSSSSTPHRIVFDPSATYLGCKLNDFWAKGPNIVKNLLGMLLRFREDYIALYGDIRKMYHTVHLPILEQHCHRFLWRDLDMAREPDKYAITRNSFGNGPAGVIAHVGLDKCAEYMETDFPLAGQTIREQVYVDDIMDCVTTRAEAQKRCEDIEKVLAVGGFQIKCWTIGRPDQDAESEPTTVQSPAERTFQSEAERVLGMEWDPVADTFGYTVRLNFDPKKNRNRRGSDLTPERFQEDFPTELSRRLIYRHVNGLFDPMGIAQPYVVKLKVLLRRLWKNEQSGEALSWDAPIPKDDYSMWRHLFLEMFEMRDLQFPRCMKPSGAVGEPWLIVFTDSSMEAYGACAYARWSTSHGGAVSYVSYLISSKARAWPSAPGDIITVVRGELLGCLLGKRLAETIEEHQRLNYQRVLYLTDSDICRAMIQKDSHAFATFEANRLGEIRSYSSPEQWFWVTGQENIADWLTRGRAPSELQPGSTWQRGPDFLAKDFAEWPISQRKSYPDESLPGIRRARVGALTSTPDSLGAGRTAQNVSAVIDIARYSTYLRLIRVTAYVLKVLPSSKATPQQEEDAEPQTPDLRTISTTYLLPADLQRAERVWIIDAQKDLISPLKQGKYKSLTPKLDSEGIYRVGGRIPDNWLTTYDSQPPILLPQSHRLSKLYMAFIHAITHSGVATTVAKSRKKFWIIGGSRVAKSIRHNCVECRKVTATTERQKMAPLPEIRLRPAPPFYYSGLDMFGPFTVKRSRNVTAKGYGMIFTCFLTRAVYVDLAFGASTMDFMLVLRRFFTQHGQPAELYSDRGSNFVAADKELRRIMEEWDWEELMEFGANRGIKWTFSPPDAPWRNGCAESLIKSVKKSVHHAIGEQRLPFHELQTVLFEAANLVNERPVGRHPQHPEDGDYLCPNDLILGRASSRVPAGPFLSTSNPRHRHEFVQTIIDSFWRKWHRDYFPTLLPRKKWHCESRTVRVGDLCIVQDTNSKRGKWTTAIVAKAFTGSDGRVRTVQLKYKLPQKLGKDYEPKRYKYETRPVQRIVVIAPVDQDWDDVDGL